MSKRFYDQFGQELTRFTIGRPIRYIIDPKLWRRPMYRYGNSPAPQEGDYYADKSAGVVYLRHGGSWMQLSYHELSAEVRAAYADAGILLDVNFSATREFDTKTVKAIAEKYLEENGPVTEAPTELPTSQYLGITPSLEPEAEGDDT